MLFGLFKRKHTILRADIGGRIEAVSTDIKRFKVGNEVFGDVSGFGWDGLGEYVCTREEALALIKLAS